jgi:Rod binding domain-containing protein
VSQSSALGRPSFPLSPPKMQWGDNALTAPTTPGKRLPVVDKSKVDPVTLQAAEGMEAMFLDYMMKVMRQTVPKNEMDLESPATEIYRSMMDTETAQKAARTGGVGLADQIVAYLESQRYTLGRMQQQHPDPGQAMKQGQADQDGRRTGGTHEGKSNGE